MAAVALAESKPMSSPRLRLAFAVASGAAALVAAPAAPGLDFFVRAAAAQTQPAQAQPPSIEQFRSVLQNFGSFHQHARYGEVWIPSAQVVPQGWKPYAPCNWAFDRRFGWTYDDRSEWGSIVHHYGRWAHDAQAGWMWVPGTEWSPGWVAWRTSDAWVGWAPLPPEQDQQGVTSASFNTDATWTFMDARAFGRQCRGEAAQPQPRLAPAEYVPQLLRSTTLVRELRVVDGVPVFVLPSWLVVETVDIVIGPVFPWPPLFLGNWFVWWNWFFGVVVILPPFPAPFAAHAGPPPPPPIAAPPAGGGAPPPPPQAGGGGGGGGVRLPPVVTLPPVGGGRPPIVVDPRPPIVIGGGGVIVDPRPPRHPRPCAMIYPPPPGCGVTRPRRPIDPGIGAGRRPQVIPSTPIVRIPRQPPRIQVARVPRHIGRPPIVRVMPRVQPQRFQAQRFQAAPRFAQRIGGGMGGARMVQRSGPRRF
jgi:hypothetical protein